MNQTLLLSTPSPGVLHVQLNRPSKLNAMSRQYEPTTMWKDLGACFASASSNTDIRAIVLSGAGKAFTSGLDLMDFADSFSSDGDKDPARRAFDFLDLVQSMQENISAAEKCRQPVIAAIHGPCIGGGIDLITACDVRFAASDAVFSVKEVDIALAADVGTLQRLPKVVGNASWVKDICLTARLFPAQEALTHQLVSRVVEGSRDAVLRAAFETAARIAEKSPVAVVGTKNVLNYSRDHAVEDGLRDIEI
ncbi:putative enoyl CoA hydratase [Podochytrium sp. JEL0797]|nr:putative enoyl CoA hydratase [Podochytrium sp. JEL0797]